MGVQLSWDEHRACVKRERIGTEAGKRLRILTDSPTESEVRVPNPDEAKPRTAHGGVAQLGEHLPCKQGVAGSNPTIST